eukprot:s3503_g7.t1
METASRQYDQQLFKAAQPVVQPELPVRDRETWFVHRKQTALTFSDHIPVWLKPPPGKTLISTVRQEKPLQQKVRKRIRKKQADKQQEVAEEPAQQQLVAATDETGEPKPPVQTVARRSDAPVETAQGAARAVSGSGLAWHEGAFVSQLTSP